MAGDAIRRRTAPAANRSDRSREVILRNLLNQLRQFGLACSENFFVKGIAVRIHRYHCGELHDLKLPDSFRGAEFLHEVNIGDALDALGENLSCTANGMQVYAAVFLTGLESAFGHASLANNRAQAEIPYDLSLIGLLSNGSR